LARLTPDIVFTYGGSPTAVARQKRAQESGARVVFGLFNVQYSRHGTFDHVDAVITPSEFLSRFYRDAIGLYSTPLPTPLWTSDILAKEREFRSVTMVNPSPEKGLTVFASIAAAMQQQHPDIPIDVYPTRQSIHTFVQA